MHIVSFFAKIIGGPDDNVRVARVGQRRDFALALSGLMFVALSVAIGPGVVTASSRWPRR